MGIYLETADGRRIFCPPAFIAALRGETTVHGPFTATWPYWTSGPSATDLTDSEIAEYVKPQLQE